MTILLTSLLAYSIEVVAILEGAPQQVVVAAVAFFLVGATVGLVDRLRREANSDGAVDDFGLFEARLLHTPLLSGLAAIGGVLLVNTAPILAAGFTVNGATTSTLTLAKIYDVSSLSSVVVAAAFGLAPGAFLDGLQRQVDKLKKDLATSTTAG